MVTKAAVLARGNAFDPDCPTRVVLDRIGDKWTVLVIGVLADGPLRFTELRRRVGGVAPKVLTQTLRAMERDGLVTRTVFAQVPPRVDYALTELGVSLGGPIAVLTDWAEAHVGRIVAARDDFEAQGA
jgi:DNA-binding HxlR family transcriptional regulator